MIDIAHYYLDANRARKIEKETQTIKANMILSFEDFESVILDIDDLIVNRAQGEEKDIILHENKIKELLKKQGFNFSNFTYSQYLAAIKMHYENYGFQVVIIDSAIKISWKKL